MKDYRYILYTLLAGTMSFMCLSAHGQEGFVCSYEAVLRAGLEKNFDIKLSELDLKSMKGQAVTAIGLTNPYMSFDFKSNAGTEPTLTYGNYKTLDAGFVVPTRYGVDYSTGFTVGRINNVEYPSPDIPMNEAGAWASVSVSLLRGLGRYN